MNFALHLQVHDDKEGERVRGQGAVVGLVDAVGFGPGLDGEHKRANAPVELKELFFLRTGQKL